MLVYKHIEAKLNVESKMHKVIWLARSDLTTWLAKLGKGEYDSMIDTLDFNSASHPFPMETNLEATNVSSAQKPSRPSLGLATICSSTKSVMRSDVNYCAM